MRSCIATIGNNYWMAQPASLHPAPKNATPQASYPSPTHYYLARHWCSGARNALNLVCRTSKVRQKTDLGAWGRRQAQPGDWGRLSGCFSQIREIREKTDLRGRERVKLRGRGCIGLSTCERSRSWSTHLASSPLHGF